MTAAGLDEDLGRVGDEARRLDVDRGVRMVVGLVDRALLLVGVSCAGEGGRVGSEDEGGRGGDERAGSVCWVDAAAVVVVRSSGAAVHELAGRAQRRGSEWGSSTADAARALGRDEPALQNEGTNEVAGARRDEGYEMLKGELQGHEKETMRGRGKVRKGGELGAGETQASKRCDDGERTMVALPGSPSISSSLV